MRRLPLRGGNWNNGTDAGLGALNLNNRRPLVNANVGFRPALLQAMIPEVYAASGERRGKRSRIPSLS
jgi:hypothetical protein